MKEILVKERETGRISKEKVYGEPFLLFLYQSAQIKRIVSQICLTIVARLPLFSRLYGLVQKMRFSRRKILPFIERYQIDASEFLDAIESFTSFNDFFIRKLKPSTRPIAEGQDVAVLPADGRYLAFSHIGEKDKFTIKGLPFSLSELLEDAATAARYSGGAMLIARLCPLDYHRFHFPFDALSTRPRLINGPLFSVNPIALQKSLRYLSQNKRYITELNSPSFGRVQYIEVGATSVGSIHHTCPEGKVVKGAEKGYFEFGGSCLILLFEPNRIAFDRDLIEATESGYELLARFGQSMGRAISDCR